MRRNRATPFRPEGAGSIAEEFKRYGYPAWVKNAVGTAKLSLAVLLLIGIAYQPVVLPAATLMALLMVSAIAAHARVRDPWIKAVPALSMLILTVIVLLGQAA